jgi:hypothetical protein
LADRDATTCNPSSAARFLTRDPIESVTREPYAYAGNNPTNWTDPTGLGCGLFSPGDCVDAVVEAVDDTTEFVVRNRGTIATIAAAGTCLIPAVGLAGCGYAAATAFGVRAQQRVQQHGFSDSLSANLVDGGLTYLTFGLSGAFEALAGPWAGVGGVGALEASPLLGYLGRLFPAGYDITNLFGWLDEQC